MRNRTPIKNHLHEIQLVTQRSIVALIFMLILILLLIGRLGYLQLAKHTLYTTLSQKNSLELIPIEPTRGLIYDRNGVLLAENIPVFSLDITPYKAGNLTVALSEISKVVNISPADLAQFQKQLKQHRRFDVITLKLKLSEIDVAKFYENAYRFPGFAINAHLIRHYPFETTFSHVLGYIGRINMDELDDIDTINYSATNYIGKLGIEKFYEDELHGTVGYQQVENDASGLPVRILNQIKPVPGKTLYLTLDSRLQIAAEKALAGHRGAIVAIEPKTGQVLAMVSEPSYEPNVFVGGISSDDFQKLQQSPDKPLYNRALRGIYPPASTVKPYLALEGLDSEVISTDTTIFDPGWYKLKNSTHIFHDHHSHGSVNVYRAILSSCDTFFYDLAMKMGIQHIDHILSAFGFGELTGIDLEEELPGVVASPEWKRRIKGVTWYPGDTLISGIGQGFMQATPLQLAVAVATLANHGEHYAPTLLLGDQDPGQHYHAQAPNLTNTITLKDKRTWTTVIDAMQGVITAQGGTGYRFGHAPYSVAAKTGTAQVYNYAKRGIDDPDANADQSHLAEHLRDHSLFIAFAPVENPQIAMAVIVENSKEAASVARQVMDYYLLELKQIKGPNYTKNNAEKKLNAGDIHVS
jgi:penicillin-binding protein 2